MESSEITTRNRLQSLIITVRGCASNGWPEKRSYLDSVYIWLKIPMEEGKDKKMKALCFVIPLAASPSLSKVEFYVWFAGVDSFNPSLAECLEGSQGVTLQNSDTTYCKRT